MTLLALSLLILLICLNSYKFLFALRKQLEKKQIVDEMDAPQCLQRDILFSIFEM